MPGKLDEISEAIGRLRASVTALQDAVATLASQQMSLHRDNEKRIDGLRDDLAAHARNDEKALAEIDRKLGSGAIALTRMQPQLAALQAMRSRVLWFAAIGLLTLVMIGRATEIGLAAGFAWLFDHLH